MSTLAAAVDRGGGGWWNLCFLMLSNMFWKVMRGDKVVKSVSDRGLMGGSPGRKISVAHGHCLSLREIVSQREKSREKSMKHGLC